MSILLQFYLDLMFSIASVRESAELGEQVVDQLDEVVCSNLASSLMVGLLEDRSSKCTCRLEQLGPAFQEDSLVASRNVLAGIACIIKAKRLATKAEL